MHSKQVRAAACTSVVYSTRLMTRKWDYFPPVRFRVSAIATKYQVSVKSRKVAIVAHLFWKRNWKRKSPWCAPCRLCWAPRWQRSPAGEAEPCPSPSSGRPKKNNEREREKERGEHTGDGLSSTEAGVYLYGATVPLPTPRRAFSVSYPLPHTKAGLLSLVSWVSAVQSVLQQQFRKNTHPHPPTHSFFQGTPIKDFKSFKGFTRSRHSWARCNDFPPRKADVFSMANRLARATLRKKTHK